MEGMLIVATTTLSLQAAPDAPFGSSLLGMISQTGGFALVILLILLVFSLFSWTLIIRKWMTLRQIRQKNHHFIDFFRKSTRLSEIHAACDHYTGSPLAGIFTAAYRELNTQIQALQNHNPDAPSLTERNVTGIQRMLQRASASELSILEKNLSWLATTGAVTPFIGLLGTVVGIINAFAGLGFEKTASIQAVAPGISEALIATAAGLFAAIPAVIAYNYFINEIKAIASDMDDFTTEFLNLVERSFT
jgi:biopolymer transport protein TolQ